MAEELGGRKQNIKSTNSCHFQVFQTLTSKKKFQLLAAITHVLVFWVCHNLCYRISSCVKRKKTIAQRGMSYD